MNSYINRQSFITLFLFMVLNICSSYSYAGKEPELRSFKMCNNITTGDTLLVYDQLFLNSLGVSTSISPSNYHLHKTLNYITLEVDQNTVVDCNLPQFSLTAIVQIDRLDAYGNTIGASQNITLDINYDKTLVEKYKEKHTFTFEGGFWYKAQIVSITPSNTQALPFVKISIGTSIERYQDIDKTTIPTFNLATYNSSNTEININWNAISGAEAYDLEWVWYDDYANSDNLNLTVAATDIEYSFKNNASRVTIKDNSYQLTPAFERGYLLLRVRAVGYTGAFFTHRVEGSWSSQNYGPNIANASGSSFTLGNDAIYIASISSLSDIKLHEPKLNWQYSSVFAEEGKKKEIIAYFDGSLHNRQTVTKVNTDQQAIVGETVYDYLGRPAVNILPAPAFENKLKFYPGFNLSSVSNAHYRRSDFDLDNGNCSNPVNTLSDASGAGLYYSSNNPLSLNTTTRLHNEYIANSFGYPFTVTEYTPDATGRIRRQGGVGPTHQLGTGHETKYYYGRPDQEELDMLFGNSVGYKYHYQKNMVVDPNGQVSISYLDLSGRVIATALAGNTPSNVQILPNIGSSVSMTVDVKSNADLQYASDHIYSNKVFMVPMQSNYTIDYQIEIPRHTDPSKSHLCFDCVYDLEISLLDECNKEMLDGNPNITGNQSIIRTLGKVDSQFDTLCEPNPLNYSFTNDADLNNAPIVVNLPIGSYTLIKKLKINYGALEFYENQFIKGNNTLKTENSYRQHYLSKIDYSQCASTCDSCEIKLGSREDYVNKQSLKLTELGIEINEEDLNYFNAQFDDLLNFCNELCNNNVNNCESMLEIIKNDLRPGGQYALYDLENNIFKGLLDEEGNSELGFNYQKYWYSSGDPDDPNNPQINYLDVNNNIIKIEIGGVFYTINELSPEQFVKYFKEEWLNSLLNKHPEYCKYYDCIQDKGSNTYDNNMYQVSSWQEALDSGFLNPLQMAGVGFSSGRLDPFFASNGRGVSKKTELQNKLNLIKTLQGETTSELSIWQLVYATFMCKTDNSVLISELNTCINNMDWNHCAPYLDRMWEMYRALYLAEKQKIKEALSPTCGFLSTAQQQLYQIRFLNTTQLQDSLSNNINVIGEIKATINTRMDNACKSNCESQADLWMQSFVDCNLTSSSYDLLKSRLINVCRDACDYEHPFGASNVPNGRALRFSSTHRSFKEVFDKMVEDGLIVKTPGLCDVNKLSVWSYEHFSENNNISPADTNRCDSAWVNADECVKNEQDPIRKQSMAVWISVDTKTQCKKCIDCDQFNIAVQHLYNEYCGNFYDTSYFMREVATNVINKYLKFNLTWFDYEDFAKKCLGKSDTSTNHLLLKDFKEDFIPYVENYTPKNKKIFDINVENEVKISQHNDKQLFEISTYKPKDWYAGSQYSGYGNLYASNNATYQINSTYTKYLSPCFCNKLQDGFINFGPNPPTPTEFNNIFSGCTPAGFDFWGAFQKCKEAWESQEDPSPGPLLPNSNWSQNQKTALENLVIEDDIEVPTCDFTCDDDKHPSYTNSYYDKPPQTSYPSNPSQGNGGNPPPSNPASNKKIVPCDSFLNFAIQLKTLTDGDLDLIYIFNRFFYEGTILPPDTVKLNLIMNYFYGITTPLSGLNNFPHARPPKFPWGWEYYRSFMFMYADCIKMGDVPGDCCMKNTQYTSLLRKLFNSFSENKGSLGNYFAYSGWNMSPHDDEYANTYLYKNTIKSCSTNLKFLARNNRMPQIKFSIKDNCGDSSVIGLSFTKNLNNKINFSKIVEFYNFKPVSNIACDTTKYFHVDVKVVLKDGSIYRTTLRGQAVKYKLKDTCTFRDTAKLCDKPFIHSFEYKPQCKDRLETMANFHAKKAYQEYIDSVRYDFRQKYIAKCMTAFDQETYTITYPHLQYHYTLYYYDQADNLIQTVPPAGVNINNSPSFLLAVKNARDNNATGSFPSHNMATRYKYNTLNQLVWQTTPDGGASEFWYDQVGRLVVSRNAKQNATSPKSYSYTNFDPLGRITEVGEMQSSTTMTVALAFSPTSLANFINASSKKEVTRTLYDIPFGTFPSNTYFTQRNMRGRVSSIQYFETLSSGANATGTYNQAVHYTYDIHGNVDVLMREMPNLSNINQAYKTTHYEYDLVSGKVNQVIYQKQHADQFAHKYSYDGDNRIINTYTSTNMVHWDKEAHYSYYLHGPLKRTELGELKVQGVDYAYTLHGWLKGVNSTTLQEDRDIGQDGNGSSINQFVAKDVFGFSLGYYEGDHTPIGMNRTLNPLTIAQQFTPSTVGTTLGNASPNLYNGNIRHMVTAILPFMNAFNPQARAYNYDQLNRIKDAYTYNQVNLGSNTWSTTAPAVSDYEEHFSYDPNGNIMTLQRNGTNVGGGALLMDNFTYNYTSGKNQLTHVDDVVPLANYGDDIDDQLSGNYSYDEIGNLISDQAEQIQEIKWTVYGKIKSIIRSSGSAKPNLAYEYSPDGHRVYKKVTQPNGNIKETYYIRDAQGNTMSTYTYDTDTFRWSESHIYGSSRIGIYNAEQVLVISNIANSSTLQANEYENIRGKRHYELSNHLGNVLAVVSDRRTGICTGNGLIAYNAEVVSATDYYAFGSPMPGRQGIQQCSTYVDTVYVNNYIAQEDFSSSSVGGFVAGTGSITVSNPTGNVLHIESIWTSRPLATKTVAVTANTNYTLDFDIVAFSDITGFTESVRVRIFRPGGSTLSTTYTVTGSQSINFTSVNAGNVTIEISQVITGSGSYGSSPNPFVDIDNLSMYYITMTLDTLTVCSVWDKGYRYGFNGKEIDKGDEGMGGGGSTYDYGFRIYNPSLGKFLSVDPLAADFAWLSTYSYAANTPIWAIDLDGLEPVTIQQIDNFKKDIEQAKSINFTIFVDQPGVGGDRDNNEGVPFVGSGIDVGHTFIQIIVKKEDGSTSSITMGFYPGDGETINPVIPNVTGSLENDGGHIYDVKYTTEIDKTKASNVLDYANETVTKDTRYDLNNFNCTDFGLESAKKAGIDLPDTQGSWTGGGGSNPGDLGEDIRKRNIVESLINPEKKNDNSPGTSSGTSKKGKNGSSK